LWDIPGPISAMTNDDRLIFSSEDEKALQQKPVFYLDINGKLNKWKEMPQDKSKLQTWNLSIGEHQALWHKGDIRNRLLLLSPFSSERVQSESGRYVVQREDNGAVSVYDYELGKSIEDTWLIAAFGEFLSRKDLGNSMLYLTEDLNYFVIFPRRRWKNITDFMIDDKSYSREANGIVYARPEINPRVFHGLRNGVTPFRPLSLEKQLRFLDYSETSLIVRDINGDEVLMQSLGEKKLWLKEHGVRIRHDDADNTISFLLTPGLVSDRNSADSTIHILLWYYNDSKVDEYSIRIHELFELRKGGYYPKRLIPESSY
jgi:hypothetical protein